MEDAGAGLWIVDCEGEGSSVVGLRGKVVDRSRRDKDGVRDASTGDAGMWDCVMLMMWDAQVLTVFACG